MLIQREKTRLHSLSKLSNCKCEEYSELKIILKIIN